MTLTITNTVNLGTTKPSPVAAIKRIIDELCANPSEDEFTLDVEALERYLEELRQVYKVEFIEDLPGPISFVVDETCRCGDTFALNCSDFMNVLERQQRREQFARAA